MKVFFSIPRKICLVPEVKQVIVSLLFIFLLFFPKGGIKLQGFPVTWGFLLFLTLGFSLFFQKQQVYQKKAISLLLALLPFNILAFCCLGWNGYVNLADTVSLILNFFVFPYIVFLCFPQYISSFDLLYILKWLKKGVFFVAVFGIGLFFYKYFFGSFFEIPFLTVNYHDFHDLEATKCIDRGGIFKLISTYNNGNLYGVCILMLMPLYCFYETSFLRKLIVKSSLILTLSRTIWIGLVFFEILNFYFVKTNPVKKTALFFSNLFLLAGFFWVLDSFFPLSWEFIFDRFFGNRIGQLEVLNDISWFAREPFEGIFEVVYLGVLKSFGLIGVITFLLFFLSPFLLLIYKKIIGETIPNYKIRAAAGLGVYLLLAGSDGALLLIPVMCFCLFLMFLIALPLEEPKDLVKI